MRSTDSKGAVLSGAALGLIGLCFLLLLHEVVISKQAWEVIPRIVAGMLAPVPIGIFFAFAYAHRGGAKRVEPSPIRTTFYLLISIGLTIVASYLFHKSSNKPIGIGMAVTESAVFSASLLNYFFMRSSILAAALSGVSVGLTVFLIFLT